MNPNTAPVNILLIIIVILSHVPLDHAFSGPFVDRLDRFKQFFS
jgi:hypothetical protein